MKNLAILADVEVAETIRLYKFYSAKSALRNLEQGQLKMSRIDELNDPFEWNGIALASKEDRATWRSLRKKIWSNRGLICFSDRWSNPVLWSHYADQHRGLCIGVDVPRARASKVEYRSTRVPGLPLAEILATRDSKLLERASLVKYSHWKYETEWRVFFQIDPLHQNDQLVFEPFSQDMRLAEVIIGPDSDITSSEIREILQSDIPIRTARLAFRSFRVVNQRAKRLAK